MDKRITLGCLDKPDILPIVSQYVNLRKAGKNYFGLCPFHSEKTPSFTVDPDKQRWHCFGCSTGGDVLDFVQKVNNTDFKGALSILGVSNDRPYRPDPVRARKKALVRKFETWKQEHDGHLLDLHRLTMRLLDASSGPGKSDLERILEAAQQELAIFDSRDVESVFNLYRQARHGK